MINLDVLLPSEAFFLLVSHKANFTSISYMTYINVFLLRCITNNVDKLCEVLTDITYFEYTCFFHFIYAKEVDISYQKDGYHTVC